MSLSPRLNQRLSAFHFITICLAAGDIPSGFFLRRRAAAAPTRPAQSEEIHNFVEEIHNFIENALTNQKKALPLSHLPRER